MSFENFFSVKKSVTLLFKTLKTIGNSAKEATKACVIDVRIKWVSICRCLITKSSNQTPVIGHPRDLAPIT